MSSKDGGLVNVVSVSPATPWVVLCEAQGIEVLRNCDDWGQLIVILEARKPRFNQLSRYRQWVVRLDMQLSSVMLENRRWYIGPVVSWV